MKNISKHRAEYYLNNQDEATEPWIVNTCSQRTIAAAAKTAASAIDTHGRKHPHQYRLQPQVLAHFGDEIAALVQKRKYTEFHQLLTDVATVARSIRGIGRVAVYDTSLRLGFKLGLRPDRVYLHAGTRQGAQFYGIQHANPDFILQSELPVAFDGMPPHDVEDFLCLYKGGKLRFGGGCAPATTSRGKRC